MTPQRPPTAQAVGFFGACCAFTGLARCAFPVGLWFHQHGDVRQRMFGRDMVLCKHVTSLRVEDLVFDFRGHHHAVILHVESHQKRHRLQPPGQVPPPPGTF